MSNVKNLMNIVGFVHYRTEDTNTISYRYKDYLILIVNSKHAMYVDDATEIKLYSKFQIFKDDRCLMWNKTSSKVYEFLNEEFKDIIRQHKIKGVIE